MTAPKIPGLLPDDLARQPLDRHNRKWRPTPIPAAAPDATQSPIYRAMLANTPLADTLNMVAGKPKSVDEHSGLMPADRWWPARDGMVTQGTYAPATDAINLSRAARADEGTLIHEYGHRLDLAGDKHARAAFDSAMVASPQARPAAGQYANTNNEEQFAEAFRHAVGWLRTYAKPSSDDPMAMTDLEAFERRVPGTTALARYLVARPPYSGHRMASALSPVPSVLPAVANGASPIATAMVGAKGRPERAP